MINKDRLPIYITYKVLSIFLRKIAAEVGENIDVIVGGHSHSLLWNGKSPSKEYVSGPYPVLVKSDNNPDHQVKRTIYTLKQKSFKILPSYTE